MKLFMLFGRHGAALQLARFLLSLLLFSQFAAASASHGLSDGSGLVTVCTTTGIKYVKAPDRYDARVPEPDAQADHCVLCMLPPLPSRDTALRCIHDGAAAFSRPAAQWPGRDFARARRAMMDA
ncbi:MAG: hypothetical protein KBF58_06150 [Methyloversatilis sp.]|jgi:hypothetical protein|nr:hypothetical protein [Methyloversatilis sp.]MBP6193212.1 hypothetical protein [Methyloversatilis sp.]MBP9117645.1 hypothetical protein [Methyloversatilis sp.]